MPSRKDNKGRVLEKGESQRTDGTYMYRWTDLSKKRQTIYARTLNELRQKELQVTKTEIISGVSWESNKITVRELIDRYLSLKKVRITTEQKYRYLINMLDKIQILDIPIKDIKTSLAKQYMITLSNMGYSYGTVQNAKTLLKPAFQMAVEDDYIVKNPFLFTLSNIIENDSKQRFSMSEDEENHYIEFISNHGWFRHIYDDVVILLNTGMRVSELYGLTFKDVDLKNRRINVNKQLHRIDGKYVVLPPKSKAGNRILAMNDATRKAFMQKRTEVRPKVEYAIDGYTGFVFINHLGFPKTRRDLEGSMREVRKKHIELGLGELPQITPHVLRHTFCSRMVEKGMNVKTLQLVMGHSDISTTLDVYTHKKPDDVAKEMEQYIAM